MAIAFGAKAQKRLANVWITGFLIANAIVLVVKFLYSTGYIIIYPHWFKVNYPFGLLRPPLIYLYVSYIFRDYQKIEWRTFLHFVPFLVLLAYMMPFFIQSSSYKIDVLNRVTTNTLGVIPSWYIYFQFGYSLIYLGLIYKVLREYMIRFPSPSNSQKQVTKWIKLIIAGGIVFLVLAFIFRITDQIGDYSYPLYIIFSIMLILLCIKIFTLPDFLSMDVKSFQKYNKSPLSDIQKSNFLSDIDRLMTEERLFRNKDLKLADIAQHLSIPEYKVSQVINEKSGQSFRDYLNGFRIEEAIKILGDKELNYSIEGIAFEVGFNSRASFYNAFKKFTNQTPTDFLKSYR